MLVSLSRESGKDGFEAGEESDDEVWGGTGADGKDGAGIEVFEQRVEADSETRDEPTAKRNVRLVLW